MPRCLHCGAELDSERRYYCGSACKMRAHRRRRKGVPVNAYPGPCGARRGPVKLGILTLRELKIGTTLMSERVLGVRVDDRG